MPNEKYKWIDPDPDSNGVLLSDRIRFYVEKINMIDPFDEKSLRPAAYTLHVGDEFWSDDRQIYPNSRGEIIINRNALIYFRIKEKFNLPYYMIAQHNLRVKQQYRGLLVGVSLHIDPGYSGHINYFAYNFTDEEKLIKTNEEIAVVEFIKTTPFGSKDFWDNKIGSEKNQREVKIIGIENHECLKFQIQEDRPINKYFIGGEQHRSSVLELRNDFNKIDKSFKSLKIIGIGAIIAIIIAIFGLFLRHYYWTSNQIINIQNEISNLNKIMPKLEVVLEGKNAKKITDIEKTIEEELGKTLEE